MTRARSTDDTIIALASGAGRAGVAVVRISGPGAAGLLALLGGMPLPEPRKAAIRALRADGSYLDEALVLYMPGPSSFTGEDVVELHVHGGPAVVEAVLGAALKSRMCRVAEPGEFTRRAFEAGSSISPRRKPSADLIDAETEGQRRQAARIYQGEAAQAFEGWRGQLISAMAALEAAIDFPDESDVPHEIDLAVRLPRSSCWRRSWKQPLAKLRVSSSVREGFRVAILGAPNAGKSSVMNRLARQDAAIVSPIPGTTRDVVEVRLVIAGFPVWVADTAGLRETVDAMEAEGVRRALARAEHADLRIWVVDARATRLPPTFHVKHTGGPATSPR